MPTEYGSGRINLSPFIKAEIARLRAKSPHNLEAAARRNVERRRAFL